MSAELRERLQLTLGAAYSLERELGGGGMSRVFVAEERSLGRKVVVKVLSPELAAGLSVERFRREIQVAAKLQQANIVPVLSSGEMDGLPYYTMPLVEGLSLRGRLATVGALPVGEVLGILKDVARALAYAHDHGVFHRDIKPDNVLLSGGTAVVTDFGIAKAISASRAQAQAEGRTSGGAGTLTEVGTSLGTPAYMAPEQAAGDPSADHRSDLYALGIMAYEMLAGRTPFHGLPPHRLLAAQMTEAPRPVVEVRPDTPAALSELIIALLAKDPERRPRTASDVVRVLESAASTSSGAAAAVPVLLAPRVALGKALALYAAAVVAVPIVARAAVIAIGLPDWVFPGSVVVMAFGLPVILFTHFVQRAARRAITRTPTLTPGGSSLQGTVATMAVRVSPHVTWRRTALGGVAALAVLVLLTIGYMSLRALGIGPAGSLMAAGVLGARERLIVADFRSPRADTTLGPVLTEALRADLAQSRNLIVVQPTSLRDVLTRMQRAPDSRVDFALAREIASREGIKAVIDGEVLALGESYVISAKLISAQTGDVLATFRETADDGRGMIDAVGRLSRDVRTKVGESLRSVQGAPALARVTTPSIEALRKYVGGVRAFGVEGDLDKGVELLEEAIALDTGFAMAYRKLAIELNNRGGFEERVVRLLEKAYAHRDRLSDAERYLTMAAYFGSGPAPDEERQIAAYHSLLELQPDNATALNNLSVAYQRQRRFDRALEYAQRAIKVSPEPAVHYHQNILASLVSLGRLREADAAVAEFGARLPGQFTSEMWRANVAWQRGAIDSSRAIVEALRRSRGGERAVDRETGAWLLNLAVLGGQLREARRWGRELQRFEAQGSAARTRLLAGVNEALREAWFLGDGARALRTLDSSLAVTPLERVPSLDRPYLDIVRVAALAGKPARARAVLADFERRAQQVPRLDDEIQRQEMLGEIALAEGRYPDALRAFRAADQGECLSCALPLIARAYDLMGERDSAIAVLERWRRQPDPYRPLFDGAFMAGAEKRLGELYEEKGDRSRALSHYLRFVELWKDADPELQPKVTEVRQRVARLRDTERR